MRCSVNRYLLFEVDTAINTEIFAVKIQRQKHRQVLKVDSYLYR
jgi:hypothetical protein